MNREEREASMIVFLPAMLLGFPVLLLQDGQYGLLHVIPSYVGLTALLACIYGSTFTLCLVLYFTKDVEEQDNT